ncbi:hypothetical protein LSH36_220g01011 [Paralvinella palmiformis]|uniref:Uncharacterized protein n=1 Tax=Paralvinella palmiformis TaxID=53620 RepID=A0AAD9JN88_9ANNE|nr:hypothetical protein LSH36_220g01011 [Paralvinella palmiformis]
MFSFKAFLSYLCLIQEQNTNLSYSFMILFSPGLLVPAYSQTLSSDFPVFRRCAQIYYVMESTNLYLWIMLFLCMLIIISIIILLLSRWCLVYLTICS